jgi:hypothetical protein
VTPSRGHRADCYPNNAKVERITNSGQTESVSRRKPSLPISRDAWATHGPGRMRIAAFEEEAQPSPRRRGKIPSSGRSGYPGRRSCVRLAQIGQPTKDAWPPQASGRGERRARPPSSTPAEFNPGKIRGASACVALQVILPLYSCLAQVFDMGCLEILPLYSCLIYNVLMVAGSY